MSLSKGMSSIYYNYYWGEILTFSKLRSSRFKKIWSPGQFLGASTHEDIVEF